MKNSHSMRNGLQTMLRRYPYEAILVLILAVWIIVMSFLNGNFLSFDNFITVVTRMSEDGVVAVGMTLVIILGGIDLSVGAIMALVACSTGLLYGLGLAFFPALLIGIGSGALVGFVNSCLIVNVKIQPMIATLATMTAVRSIVYGITDGRPVATFPEGFGSLASTKFLEIPLTVYLLIAVSVGILLLLNRTKFGRFMLATGGNERAARASGIDTNRVKRTVYMISALLSALGGIMFASRMTSASPDIGLNTAFDVMTAVLLGGTSILGGQGSVLRTLMGVFLMNLIVNGLNLIRVDAYWQTIFMGCVLVAVVGFDEKRKKGGMKTRRKKAEAAAAK